MKVTQEMIDVIAELIVEYWDKKAGQEKFTKDTPPKQDCETKDAALTLPVMRKRTPRAPRKK
ncbi:hypothetical protein [Schlesneria paludicola]|uniref:hypothetical protein n=1 Tax=Schlesneria paludicola TaxID=360056 RepID=UPI0002F40DF7|nr:hypothetical protein [Schlesneria paludicola]